MPVKLPGTGYERGDVYGPSSGRSGRDIARVDLTPVGEGIEKLGSGLASAGGNVFDLGELQFQRSADERQRAEVKAERERRAQETEVDRAAHFQQASDLINLDAETAKLYTDLTTKAKPGAVGLTDELIKQIDAKYGEYYKSVADKYKPQVGADLTGNKNKWRAEAQKFEITERIRNGEATILKDKQTVLDGLSRDPTNWKNADEVMERLIRNQPGLPTIEQEKEITKYKEERAKALHTIINDKEGPEAASRGLQEGGGGVHDLIRRREGYRSKAYWDVDHYRAGYGSDTYTDASGGVHPVTKDTVITRADADRDLDRRTGITANEARNKVGAEAWDRLDAPVKAALIDLAYNYGSLPDRVLGAVRSGDRAAMSQAVARLGMDNNGINRERRAEEAAIISGRQTLPDGGVAPYYADMSFEDRQKLYDADMKEIGQNARIYIEQTTNDALTSYGRGEKPPTEPTLEEYVKGYGPDEGAIKYQSYEAAKATAQAAAGLATKSEAEILALLKAADDAVPVGPGAKVAQDNLEVLTKAAAQTLKARNEAPAAYVAQVYPEVQKAWTNVDWADPETGKAAIALSIDKQKQLGIDPYKIQPIPPDKITEAKNYYLDSTKDYGERAHAISRTVLMTSDPQQQQAIYRELVKAGVPASVEAAIEAAARGDDDAAERLYEAALAKPSDIALAVKDLPDIKDNRDVINSAIAEEMTAPGSRGYSFFGLKYADPESNMRAKRDTDLMQSAVILGMNQGLSQDDAITRATHDLFGDIKTVGPEDSNNLLDAVVPLDTDVETLTTGLNKMIPQVRLMIGTSANEVRDALIKKAAEDGALPPAQRRAAVDFQLNRHVMKIVAEGVFRDYGYEDPKTGPKYGFYDSYTRTFVKDTDGKPLLFSHDQVMLAGKQPVFLGDPGEKARRQYSPLTGNITDPSEVPGRGGFVPGFPSEDGGF